MKLLLSLVAAATLPALSGCETVVAVDTPPHTPRLALTYTLSNQPATPENTDFFQVRNLFVSSSQGVLETRGLAGRKDATVQLLDESGQVVEQFRARARAGIYYNGSGQPQDSIYGYYVPSRGFVGVPGRTYTLRATAPGLEAVAATLTLPAAPVIESAGYVAQASSTGYNSYEGRLTVALTDNAATTDYYLAYARVLDRNGQYWGSVRRNYNSAGNSPDINLGRFQLSESTNLYAHYPFSDAGIAGQRFSLSADVVLQYEAYATQPLAPAPAYIEVVASGITPDTYRFYQSLQRYYDTDGNPFAEPAPLYSNLHPGYGLFGGATDVRYRIAL